jgi:sulfoacetaldehyde dehydrogenase
MLIVEEIGGRQRASFSGEKMSPVLAFYRVPGFRRRGLHLPSASCGIRARAIRLVCTADGRTRALQLGLTLPVCRVIVNQAHCFATGGSFDNALPVFAVDGLRYVGRQQHFR